MKLPSKPIFNEAFKERGLENIIKWDVVTIENLSTVILTFESVNSEWRQGVWLKTDNGIFINTILYLNIELWYDTAPKTVKMNIRTKENKLHIYNIWDRGKGRESQAYTSGMILIVDREKRIYKCNDIGFDTDFSKLVFSITQNKICSKF